MEKIKAFKVEDHEVLEYLKDEFKGQFQAEGPEASPDDKKYQEYDS